MAKYKYGKSLTLGGIRIECNITQRCNARCDHCNKAVGYADGLFEDMTLEQMKRAVDQLIEQEVYVTKFTFCGGEPILHKDLQEMVYEVGRLPTLRQGRLLTNGMSVSQKTRDKIILPDKRFKWVVNPLDDINDPFSGKSDPKARSNKRTHKPFWISPDDMGLESTFENCTVRGWCGIGLDSSGWSMCGKAVMFGALLGVDGAAMKEGNILEHTNIPINDICKHCQYGLPSRKEKKTIWKKYRAGQIEPVSPTFEKIFEEHKGNLVQLER